MTEKRYYRDFGGENGTIIRDRITNEEVFEFGISDSKDLCNLLNEQNRLIEILSFDCEVFIKEIERMKFILKKKFDYDIEEVVAEIYDDKTK